MNKKCKVVILPTNSWSTIQIVGIKKHQHLYILSDDEIKVDDWITVYPPCYDNNSMKYIPEILINDDGSYNNSSGYLKVIASTDSLLTQNTYYNTGDFYKGVKSTLTQKGIPSIPQSFIDKYVSEYNKGNKIEEVMVEYFHNSIYDIADGGKDYYLKLNPDNNINIQSIKDSWTRDEVRQVLINFRTTDISVKYGQTSENIIDEWIKENL